MPNIWILILGIRENKICTALKRSHFQKDLYDIFGDLLSYIFITQNRKSNEFKIDTSGKQNVNRL